MSLEQLYISTFAVQRTSEAESAVGGITDGWSDLSTGNRGRLRRLSAAERDLVGRTGVVSTHRLYCGAAVDIIAKDRIVLSSKTYEVNSIYEVDEMGHHNEVDMTLRA